MTGEGQLEIHRRHAAPIVGDAHQAHATLLQLDAHTARTSIECILHQLLDDGGGTLDHLARSDLVDD